MGLQLVFHKVYSGGGWKGNFGQDNQRDQRDAGPNGHLPMAAQARAGLTCFLDCPLPFFAWRHCVGAIYFGSRVLCAARDRLNFAANYIDLVF